MKKYLKPILKPIIEKIRDKRATHYIKKVSRKSIHQVVKVAFIVFEPESWDKLQPVYEAMAERKNFEPWLIVVPSKDNNLSLEKTYGYEKNFFEEKYNNIILAYDKNGNVTSVLIANRDVTDEKIRELKQEEELREAKLKAE